MISPVKLLLIFLLVGFEQVQPEDVRTPRGCVCSDFTWFRLGAFVSTFNEVFSVQLLGSWCYINFNYFILLCTSAVLQSKIDLWSSGTGVLNWSPHFVGFWKIFLTYLTQPGTRSPDPRSHLPENPTCKCLNVWGFTKSSEMAGPVKYTSAVLLNVFHSIF
jgi:hypothetical protein